MRLHVYGMNCPVTNIIAKGLGSQPLLSQHQSFESWLDKIR